MGLPLTILTVLGAASWSACAGAPSTARVATAETSSLPSGDGAAAALQPPGEQRSAAAWPNEWPERHQVFLVRTAEAELVLRAFGAAGMAPFEQLLARDVGNVLHNPELDLVWYNVDSRLFVMDMRQLGPGIPEPVLIARDVPIVGGSSVERDGVRFTAPGSRDDDGLELHWSEAPWIAAGEDEQRIDNLDGRAWLARERHRAARSVPPLQGFDTTSPRVAMPEGRASCDSAGFCGAALPFGHEGWQLVVAKEDYQGDFPAYGCLLHDPATRAFATPPDARKWAPAGELEPGMCGPFLFDAASSVYLASSVVCRVSAACGSLGEGSAIGWLEPGPMIGTY